MDYESGNCDTVEYVYEVYIEVCQSPASNVARSIIEPAVRQYLRDITVSGDTELSSFESAFLREHIRFISINVRDYPGIDKKSEQGILLSKAKLHIHVFHLHNEGPATEDLDDEELAAARQWLLPTEEFNGLWESLVFDSNIKLQLLNYATTTLLFSDKNVNSNIISCNRVVLLHGPPGTGKTTLSKALAQKLCIRLSHRYAYGQLIEINSHSLFSKWFSESGKLVMKMFQKIQELIDDKDALVIVLIDEVESLTTARKASMSGSEPSDAIRVVNAVLTQIDQIRRYPNVIILATSNITGAIDLAFVDRADIKQYLGYPSHQAVYKILYTCIEELIKCGIVKTSMKLVGLKELASGIWNVDNEETTRLSHLLSEISLKAAGLSGRTIRKIPFLAHALFLKSESSTLEQFLEALSKAVEHQIMERSLLALKT